MMNKYIGIIGLFLVLLASCAKDEIMKYDAATRALYVPASDDKDTLEMSFKHYVGIDDYEIRMPVCLAGDYLTEDRIYKLAIDEELTTAEPEDYTIDLEQVFHSGLLEDSLTLVVHRTPHLSSEKVVLVVRLVPNETFGVAEYMGDPTWTSLSEISSVVRIWFSDMLSRPDWWDTRITRFFLGKYSDEKYARFIESSGRTDMEGCSTTEMRRIMQKFSDDIRENDWREADGSPMEIVMN